MIAFGKDLLQNVTEASSREWLETNGIGGFASSTTIGLNNRRYHGLLVAATRPPAGRVVLLSKLEETVVVGERSYDLGTNQYPGAMHPAGYRYLEAFRLDPFPVFTFVVDGLRIEKTVFMVQGENTAVVQYRLLDEGRSVRLELRPLIAFRDYHATTHENGALDAAVQIHNDALVSMKPYEDLPRLYLAHNGNSVSASGYWYRNFEYSRERERGLDFLEDLFNPATLSFTLESGVPARVIASLKPLDVRSAGKLQEKETERRSSLASGTAIGGKLDSLVQALTAAADQYIVARGDRKTIVAGYPWFTDWGRDTTIALPGLALANGHYDVARSILLEFARHVDRGMLPNRFPDSGETPEYNTIDATLWYFEAIRAFLEYTDDYAFVRKELLPVLTEIVDWHVRGTRYGIHMDEDGLLASTDASVQLTWMDARVGDWVVTPRHGKAVEIQALWYNALKIMDDLSRNTGAGALAARTKSSFNARFWNEETGYLYDTIQGNNRDATLRPNQILAVSLHHSMLPRPRARQVVAAVERDLFTPFGLRSLSPSDPRYRGRYEGGPSDRDSSYHQGPVWPWLLGPFIDAYLRVNSRSAQALRTVTAWLEVFTTHLGQAGLGHVSEIFDGDAPHQPRGCFAQAWSVAELLRVAVAANRAGKPEGNRMAARAK
jgi:predicted glycogen debranching enzyme